MKINTKVSIKDLSGKEIKDGENVFTLGQALANIIVNAKEGGKMKLYILGTKLYQNKLTDIDESDLALLKKSVETTETYGSLIAGQCLALLEDVK